MAIYKGNRRPDLGHGHDYIEKIKGNISIEKFNSILRIYIAISMAYIDVDMWLLLAY